MLLSRVAETVYWAGRYLERAEATARIVKVHTEQFLDLPKEAGSTWAPLLAITGSRDQFDDLYPEPTEEHVLSFLVADPDNRSAMVAALGQARENVRTTRPVFPREAWEHLNALYLRAAETCDDAIPRRRRVAWMDALVADCQRLTGLLVGCMNQDDAYLFLRIGRHVERADMTTRVLDVHAGTLLAQRGDLDTYADMGWMNVLKSLSAYQMYRRRVQARVKGSEVLRFLLQDAQFPRSVEHSLTRISVSLLELTNHDAPMARCAAAQQLVEEAKVRALAFEGLHDYVDELQVRIGAVHDSLGATYFQGAAPAAEPVLASA
ncbi:MAG: alpha-E domain-containing protein [Acidimicrobiales bacterium]